MRFTLNFGLVAGALILVAAGAAIGFIARGEFRGTTGSAARHPATILPTTPSTGSVAPTAAPQAVPVRPANLKMVNIGLKRGGHELENESGDDSEGGR